VRRRSLRSLVFLLALGCAGVDSAAPDLERAELALAAGEPEDAADAFRSALAIHPGCREALHGLARSQIARGDGESALVVFSELKRVDGDYFRDRAAADHQFALYQAARIRFRREDPAGALRALRRLHALDPDHPGLRDLMPGVLIAESGRLQLVGRGEEAEALLLEATGERPSDAGTIATLAEELVETGRTDTAISVISNALLQNPDDERLVSLMDRALDIRYPDAP
jgi:tetratricopeptide (TPR) repeat protein